MIPSGYHPGSFNEWGVYPVRILCPDPLFRRMGRVIRVPEYHYGEVNSLPKDLVLLASSRNCRVQAFRHRLKPLYGTQFHPEKKVEAYPDGSRILRNFFRLTKSWKKSQP